MRDARSAVASVPRLATKRKAVAYLKAAIDGDHPHKVVPALKTVARSPVTARAAKRMGMTPAELRAQVLPKGRPKLDIAMKMVRALGLRFTVST